MTETLTGPTPGKKRICLLSDGTWQSNDQQVPTNVLRLAMAVKPVGDDCIPQIVHYDPGVGTQSGLMNFAIGGAFGDGIDLNIQQLYSFLSLNYNPGDEVYVVGYSRGAYTVRSLLGLIHVCGLVRRNHVHFTEEAYELYRKKLGRNSSQAVKFRTNHGYEIPIKCLLCFDTVGSLGIPNIFSEFINRNFQHRYQFHDTTIGHSVEHAIHVLSLDEWKGAFQPTIMQPYSSSNPNQVSEQFYWGDHEGVGGGHAGKMESANCSLRGAIDEMSARGLKLSLDERFIPVGNPSSSDPSPPTIVDIAARIFFTIANFFTGSGIRYVPSLRYIHPSAIKRYCEVSSWRPQALKRLHNEILGKKQANLENEN